MSKKILVTFGFDDSFRKRLEEAAAGCEIIWKPASDVTKQDVQSANIIIGSVPAKLIHASEKLELLQLNTAGADPYIVPGVLSEKTVLSNATGAYGHIVAEHTFAMMLALMKNLHIYRDNQLQGKWQRIFSGVSTLSDSTVLIFGAGDIGLRFAAMCRSFGARTIGVRRRFSECPAELDELYLTESTDALLPRADIIASFLPGNPETDRFFDARRFALMKNSALFLNSGRGSSVDTDALCLALENGVILGAGLDVFSPEPLPEGHRLWKLPNVIMTPHVASAFFTRSTVRTVGETVIKNIEAFLAGKPPVNIVDRKTGYKI